MTLEECRRFYAEEIRFTANVRSEGLIDAFARVPREAFLGPPPWRIAAVDGLLSGTAYPTTDEVRHLYHNVPPDAHEPDGTCVLHGRGACLSRAEPVSHFSDVSQEAHGVGPER